MRGGSNMRKNIRYFLLIFSIFALFLNLTAENDWPVLKGPYLGQKPPGMTPEIFAPGIISTKKNELNSVFSPKGDEFFFAICTSTREEHKKGIYLYIIMYTKQINGVWTKPETASFPGKYSAVDKSLRSLLKVAIIPTFGGIVVQVRILKLEMPFLPFSAKIFSWKRHFYHFQQKRGFLLIGPHSG
jgi:hypothetical protein